jgi:uncharacterized metal-binding protein (TIGR02443 family)
MKLNIKCPKCGRANIEIMSGEDKIPLYKCRNCGYVNRIFPKLEGDREGEQD